MNNQNLYNHILATSIATNYTGSELQTLFKMMIRKQIKFFKFFVIFITVNYDEEYAAKIVWSSKRQLCMSSNKPEDNLFLCRTKKKEIVKVISEKCYMQNLNELT